MTDTGIHSSNIKRKRYSSNSKRSRGTKYRKLNNEVSIQFRQGKTRKSGKTGSVCMDHSEKAIKSQLAGVKASWDSRFLELVKFVSHHGHSQVPQDSCLSQWASDQRQEYKLMNKGLTSKLNHHRVHLLTSLGFVLDEAKLYKRSLLSPEIAKAIANGILSGLEEVMEEAKKEEKAISPTKADVMSFGTEKPFMSSSRANSNQDDLDKEPEVGEANRGLYPMKDDHSFVEGKTKPCITGYDGSATDMPMHPMESCSQSKLDELLTAKNNTSTLFDVNLNQIHTLKGLVEYLQRQYPIGQNQLLLETNFASPIKSVAPVINRSICTNDTSSSSTFSALNESHLTGSSSQSLSLVDAFLVTPAIPSHTESNTSATTPCIFATLASPEEDTQAQIFEVLQKLEKAIAERKTNAVVISA